jgi:AcrR family transcriptional regulator
MDAAGRSDLTGTRRAAILTEAARLFSLRGFRAVSMAEIGEASGMSAASLYRFFSGKGAILAALWDQALSEALKAARAAVASASSADDRLERILHAHASLLVRKYEHVGKLVRRGSHGLPAAERVALNDKEHEYLQLWAAQLHQLLDAGEAEISTRIFTGLAILHSVALSEPQYSDDVVIDQLVVMTKAGLLAKAGPSGTSHG